MSKDGDKKSLSKEELAKEIEDRKQKSEKTKRVWSERVRLQGVLFDKTTPIVDQMLAMESFFSLLFKQQDELLKNFEHDPESQKVIADFSKDIEKHFKYSLGAGDGKSKIPERQAFLNAFNELIPTQGYSMINYLKINLGLADYLSKNMEKLHPVFTQFQEKTQPTNTVKKK